MIEYDQFSPIALKSGSPNKQIAQKFAEQRRYAASLNRSGQMNTSLEDELTKGFNELARVDIHRKMQPRHRRLESGPGASNGFETLLNRRERGNTLEEKRSCTQLNQNDQLPAVRNNNNYTYGCI